MKIIPRKAMGCLLTALIISACTEHEELSMEDTLPTQVQFVMHKQLPNGMTRTSTDFSKNAIVFSEGDQVGIFAYTSNETGKDIELLGANVKYTLTEGIWMAEKPIELKSNWTKVNFYTYYPYSEAASDYKAIAHCIVGNQNQLVGDHPTNYNTSDFLRAKATKSSTDASSITLGKNSESQLLVNFTFEHVCALLEVVIDNQKESYKEVLPEVTLCSVKSDITEIDLTADGAAGFPIGEKALPVSMLPVSDNETGTTTSWRFCAVLPAQTVAAETPLLYIDFRPTGVQGVRYQYKLTDKDLSLSAGGLRKVTVTIPAETP